MLAVACQTLSGCQDGGLKKRTPSDLDANASAPKQGTPINQKVAVAHVNDRSGTPTFAWGTMAERPDLAGLSHQDAAAVHLKEVAGAFLLESADTSFSATKLHDTGTGPVIVTYERSIHGIDVFHEQLSVAMTRDHRLVSVSGQATALPASLANSVGVASGRLAFTRSAEDALQFALSDGASDARLAAVDWIAGATDGAYTWFNSADANVAPARVRKTYFPVGKNVVPAYYVELDLPDVDTATSQHFAYVLSATDGKMLFRMNQTADATYRVYGEATEKRYGTPLDGVYSDFSPHPTARNDGSKPAGWADSSLITLDRLPLVPESDVWLPANSQTTNGNNVIAYADLAAPDGFGAGDVIAVATSANTFDYTYNPDQSHDASMTQRLASVTQLFYTNNWLHDWYYAAGFDEASGNAQALNFGRGGLEADALKAEAQDAAGTNNANMSTPADGAPPRMQMFAFTTPSIRTAEFRPQGGAPFAPIFLGDSVFGPASYDITGDLVRGSDATGSAEGCTAPLTSDVAGKIAFIRRGTCSFVIKAQNAEAAGAVAVVIYSNQAGNVGSLAGAGIAIPGIFVDQVTGDAIAAALAAGTKYQVRLSKAGQPTHDGTLDNQIVAHEWGHFISNRLIGNATGLASSHQRGLGEGWADFHAILLTVKEGDDLLPTNAKFGGAYPIAGYAIGENTSHYHAIRRLPYSTNMAINPLTFKHISRGEALPPLAPENDYAYTGDNAQVHATGEIWASMLWECYASLLNDTRTRRSFDEKREAMKQYLVAAYKMTPPLPTLLEARDAILAAARAGNENDFQNFARAFAKRGAGLRAIAPDRFTADNVGTVESFSVGNDVAFVQATLTEKTAACAAQQDGVLDAGETATLQVTVRNTGYGILTAPVVTIAHNLGGSLLTAPTTVTFSALPPFASETKEVEVTLGAVTAITDLTLSFSVVDDSVKLPASTGELRVLANYDVVTSPSLTDDVEAPVSNFSPKRNTSLADAAFTREIGSTGSLWFGPDVGATSDLFLLSPVLKVAANEDFTLDFDHWFIFEGDASAYYDGGVVEITRDGFDWFDVSDFDSTVPYNAVLVGEGSENPLAGRKAFSGESPAGAPAYDHVQVKFGRAFAGENVRLRFRVGSDQAAAAVGWGIDNIGVAGVTNKPFTTTVADQGLCLNQPPVANAGLARRVEERSVVSLDGSGSRDMEGAPLLFVWRQVSGPAVTLTDATTATPSFTAPEVAVDTELTFSLVVNDGNKDSAAVTLTLVIANVPRGPSAGGIVDSTVDERATLTLDAARSELFEASALNFEWTQLSGPSGTLRDAAAQKASFVAPEVTSDTMVVMQLRVADAAVSGSWSAPALFEVLVRNVNRAPTLRLKNREAPLLPGALAELDASASEDLDGDALSFEWKQTAGPAVELRDSRTAKPTFVVPAVKQQTTFEFEVVAKDAQAASAPGKTSLTVDAITNNGIQPASADATITPSPKAGCSNTSADASQGLWLAAVVLLALRRRAR